MQQTEKMNIFDLLDMFSLTSMEKVLPAGKHTSEDLSEEKIMSYLHRENKILSLAKEGMRRLDDALKLSDLEEKIFSISYDEDDGLDAVLQKMARIMRKYIKNIDLEPEKIAVIQNAIGIPVEIEVADSTAIKYGIYRKIASKASQKLLKVTVRESGFPDMTVYGTLQTPHGKRYRSVLFENVDYAIADLGFLFSYLILLTKVNASIRSQPDLIECRCKTLVPETERRGRLIHWLKDFGLSLEDLKKNPVFIMEERDRILEDILASYFPGAEFINGETDRENAVYLDKAYALYFIHSCFPYEYGIRCPATYHFLLMRTTTDIYWPLPIWGANNSYTAFLAEVWKASAGVKRDLVRQFSYYKESKSEYAKSYQTKANIPQKIVAAMEKSVLNKYFGYVEYDESVDLAKILEIEKEFVAFKETFFPSVDACNNSIRFRKLGNHKAAGLYYPWMRCLCVDINCPSSLIHEFGHLIDFTYGNLSVTNRFYPILAMYKDELLRSMDGDSALQKAMQSKTKYNFGYYTMPTEVFARCFELYCTRTLGVSNSLVNASGFAYLEEPALLSKISEYFDELFIKGGIAA